MLTAPSTTALHRRVWLLLTPGLQQGLEIVRGICRFGHEQGWFVTMRDQRLVTPAIIEKAAIDGVIGQMGNPALVEAIVARGLPAVNLIRSRPNPAMHEALVDDTLCGRLAAEHLLELGFSDFAYVHANPAKHDYALQRGEGLRDRLAESGRPHRFFWLHDEQVCHSLWRIGHSHPEPDEFAWLSSLPRPIALFAVNDALATSIAYACSLLGLRVPEDVAILGVHNAQLACEMVSPPLSSVDTASELRGYLAADLLNQQFTSPDTASRTVEVKPLGVVRRQSTDVLATRDPVVVEAMGYVRRHATDRIGVAQVADALAVSRRQLERRFDAALGYSPSEAIKRERIKLALHLLATTSLSMSTIAARTSLGRQDQMARIIRESAGMTPTAYRAQFQPR